MRRRTGPVRDHDVECGTAPSADRVASVGRGSDVPAIAHREADASVWDSASANTAARSANAGTDQRAQRALDALEWRHAQTLHLRAARRSTRSRAAASAQAVAPTAVTPGAASGRIHARRRRRRGRSSRERRSTGVAEVVTTKCVRPRAFEGVDRSRVLVLVREARRVANHHVPLRQTFLGVVLLARARRNPSDADERDRSPTEARGDRGWSHRSSMVTRKHRTTLTERAERCICVLQARGWRALVRWHLRAARESLRGLCGRCHTALVHVEERALSCQCELLRKRGAGGRARIRGGLMTATCSFWWRRPPSCGRSRRRNHHQQFAGRASPPPSSSATTGSEEDSGKF